MNDPDKIGKQEEKRRMETDSDEWEQTDHNLYRYGNWFCFVKKAGTHKSVELYYYEKEHRAYSYIGSYFDFKMIVKVIEEAEKEKHGKAANAGS